MTDPVEAVQQAVEQGQAAAIAEAQAEQERQAQIEEARGRAETAQDTAHAALGNTGELAARLAAQEEVNAAWRAQQESDLASWQETQSASLASVSAQLTELLSRSNPPASPPPPPTAAVVAVEAAVPANPDADPDSASPLLAPTPTRGGHRRRILGRG